MRSTPSTGASRHGPTTAAVERALGVWVAAVSAAAAYKQLRRIAKLVPASGVRIGDRRYDRRALLPALTGWMEAMQDVEVRIESVQALVRCKRSAARMVVAVRGRYVTTGRPWSARFGVVSVLGGARLRPRRLTITKLDGQDAVADGSGRARVTARGSDSLMVVTVASYPHPGLDDLRASCDRFGIRLHVIGCGAPWAGSTHNKLRDFARFLKFEGGRHRRVLYTDAFDSVFVRPLPEIVAAFEAQDTPLLMSAEANCFPAWLGQGPGDYPPAPTPYAYVNAGGFLGEIDYLADLFDRLAVEQIAAGSSDQGWWARVYVERMTAMKLDHHCHVFQCLHSVASDEVLVEDRIRNRLTGSYPAVIHGNGRVPMARFLDFALGDRRLGPRLARRARAFVWRKLISHERGRSITSQPAVK